MSEEKHWSTACAVVNDVIEKWMLNSVVSNGTPSVPYFGLLSFFRDFINLFTGDVNAETGEKCSFCNILAGFDETLLNRGHIGIFLEAVNILLIDGINEFFPLNGFPMTEAQVGAVVSIFLQSWLLGLPELSVDVDFLEKEIDEVLTEIMDNANNSNISSFISSFLITLNELAGLFVHKCSVRDAETIQKLVSDISSYFICPCLLRFINVSDESLLEKWCNNQFSEIILIRNKESNFNFPNWVSNDISVLDELVNRRSLWFWNSDISGNGAEEILAKFPEGAYLVISDVNLYCSPKEANAIIYIKLRHGIEIHTFKRTIDSGIPTWNYSGDVPKKFHLLIDSIHWYLTTKLDNYLDLLSPVSKWIHKQSIFDFLPQESYVRLMYNVEMKQSHLNRALEVAQSEFATEQANIQSANAHPTLHSLNHLIIMYGQQRSKLKETRRISETHSGDDPADMSQFESSVALLDERLKTYEAQKLSLETQLLKENSHNFQKLQLSLRNRLQISSLDAIKLRTVVSSEIVENVNEESFEESEAPERQWMAPEKTNRTEAEATLKDTNDGCFLVRTRYLSNGQVAKDGMPYAISFRWNGETHHSVVHKIESGDQVEFSLLPYQSIEEGEASGSLFPDLAELIDFYRDKPLPISDENSPGYGAKLMTPAYFI